MLMRRTETDPATAITQLTRDIARIRHDLDNIRSAVTHRSRKMVEDTRDQITESATDAMRRTGRYAQQHPGATTGVVLGIAALIVGIVLMRSR